MWNWNQFLELLTTFYFKSVFGKSLKRYICSRHSVIGDYPSHVQHETSLKYVQWEFNIYKYIFIDIIYQINSTLLSYQLATHIKITIFVKSFTSQVYDKPYFFQYSLYSLYQDINPLFLSFETYARERTCTFGEAQKIYKWHLLIFSMRQNVYNF